MVLGYNKTTTVPGNDKEKHYITRDPRPGAYVWYFNTSLRVSCAGHSLFALNVFE
jgi:hypothetical protein